MAKAKLTVLVFLLFLFISTVKSSSSSSHTPLVPTPTSNSNEAIVINRFIWNSCKATLYHRLCYASLSSYAVSIQNDPVLLSAFAANVTLTRILLTSAHVSSVRRSLIDFSAVRRSLIDFSASAVDPRTASALEDCVETLGEATELTRKSAAELKALRTAKGADIAWHVGNAQTWMSAALTNEDTCMDGFKKLDSAVGDGRVEADVVAWVRKAEKYSSNALALVNSLVHR